jgi:hypothetical protein
MFPVSDNEPVYIKQEEDPCTEILPDMMGEVSVHLHLYVLSFLVFLLLVIHWENNHCLDFIGRDSVSKN